MSGAGEQPSVLLAQEQRLIFPHFGPGTAREPGPLLRAEALGTQLPVAISIRRNGQSLSPTALPGSPAGNDG